MPKLKKIANYGKIIVSKFFLQGNLEFVWIRVPFWKDKYVAINVAKFVYIGTVWEIVRPKERGDFVN